MDDALSRGLTLGLTMLALGAANAWWVRARARSRPGEHHVLRHPIAMLVLGVAGSFLPPLAVVALFVTDANDLGTLLLVFVPFTAIGLALLLESQVTHELVPGGLRYGKLIRRDGTLFWIDVKRLRYSPLLKWFVLETDRGDVARISVMLTSLPAFAKATLGAVPPAAIDEATRDVLMETAAGFPPSVWGP